MDAPTRTQSRIEVAGHSQATLQEQIMNKSFGVILVTLAAGSASLAHAHYGAGTPATTAQQFASQFRTLQEESTSMPSGSPPVDKNALPEDPIPKLTTLAQDEAWFRAENQRLQRESTGMPSGSPAVKKHEMPADPLPKATTPAEQAAANAAELQLLRQKSTS